MGEYELNRLQEQERAAAERLEKVKAKREALEEKHKAAKRKELNHAKFMVAGRLLEVARDRHDASIWNWARETIADETVKKYDRRCLTKLLEEYEIPLDPAQDSSTAS